MRKSKLLKYTASAARTYVGLCKVFFFIFTFQRHFICSQPNLHHLSKYPPTTPQISTQAACAIFYTRINFKMNYGTLCTSRYRIKPSSSSYVRSVYFVCRYCCCCHTRSSNSPLIPVPSSRPTRYYILNSFIYGIPV